jgi:hypothetical protein
VSGCCHCYDDGYEDGRESIKGAALSEDLDFLRTIAALAEARDMLYTADPLSILALDLDALRLEFVEALKRDRMSAF